MVVLEPVAVSAAQPAPGSPTLVGGKSNSSSGSASALRHHPSQYLPMSPYLQPPPHEYDPKSNPLSMLEQTCHKIESNMLSSNNNHATSRPSVVESSFKSSISPRLNQARPGSSTSSTSSTSPSLSKPGPPEGDFKVQFPLSTSATLAAAAQLLPKSSVVSQPRPSGSPPNKSSSPKSSASKSSSPLAAPQLPHPSLPSVPYGLYPGMPGQNPHLFPSAFGPGGHAGQPCPNPGRCQDPTCPTTLLMMSAMSASTAGRMPYHPGMFGWPPPPPPSAASPGGGLPSAPSEHVCSWVNGKDGYCGRRFSSSEDLMSHLRSHTGAQAAAAAAAAQPEVSSASSPTLSMLQAAQAHAMLPIVSTSSALAALHSQAAKVASSTTSPPITTSSSSAADRYHPYASSRASASAAIPPPHHPGFMGMGLPPHLTGSLPPPGYPYFGIPPMLYP